LPLQLNDEKRAETALTRLSPQQGAVQIEAGLKQATKEENSTNEQKQPKKETRPKKVATATDSLVSQRDVEGRIVG